MICTHPDFNGGSGVYIYMRQKPGPRLNIKTVFPGKGIPMLKIRRSRDRLIFNMGIPIMVRRHLYIEMGPRVVMIWQIKWDVIGYGWTYTFSQRQHTANISWRWSFLIQPPVYLPLKVLFVKLHIRIISWCDSLMTARLTTAGVANHNAARPFMRDFITLTIGALWWRCVVRANIVISKHIADRFG